jgi:hypothetical protein
MDTYLKKTRKGKLICARKHHSQNVLKSQIIIIIIIIKVKVKLFLCLTKYHVVKTSYA